MSGAPDVVATRLHALRERIADVAQRAGRSPTAIRVIAVSKTHAVENIEAAISTGHVDYGESMVQEALPKVDHFRRDRALTWHFIGHLQSNKAKFIPGNFAWLHSLDSLALATRLERAAAEKSVTLNALVEVNVSRDPHKHGVLPEQLDELLDSLHAADLSHVLLRGLMTIGPPGGSTDSVRACFSQLRALRDQNKERLGLRQFTELSMGMSGDYVAAIGEGATMIRLGTAIFGERVTSF